MGALSTSLASVGGFCVGSREVTDHQRLSGLGYCFSASAPPFLCATATESLRSLRNSPEQLRQLHDLSSRAHQLIGQIAGLKVVSHELSPVVHAQVAGDIISGMDARGADDFVQTIVNTVRSFAAVGATDTLRSNIHVQALEAGVLLSRSRAIADQAVKKSVDAMYALGAPEDDGSLPPAGIEPLALPLDVRVCLSVKMTDDDLRTIVAALQVGTCALPHGAVRSHLPSGRRSFGCKGCRHCSACQCDQWACCAREQRTKATGTTLWTS